MLSAVLGLERGLQCHNISFHLCLFWTPVLQGSLLTHDCWVPSPDPCWPYQSKTTSELGWGCPWSQSRWFRRVKGDGEDTDTGHQGHGHRYFMFSQQIPYQKQGLTRFGGKVVASLLLWCKRNQIMMIGSWIVYDVYVNMHGERVLEGNFTRLISLNGMQHISGKHQQPFISKSQPLSCQLLSMAPTTILPC